MDVSDTKVSLHLADAGSEVTKRTVEQTEEGEGEKKKTAARFQISAFAFDISGLQPATSRGRNAELEKRERCGGNELY